MPSSPAASPSATPLAGAATDGEAPIHQAPAAISPAARMLLMSFLQLLFRRAGSRGRYEGCSTVGTEIPFQAGAGADGAPPGAHKAEGWSKWRAWCRAESQQHKDHG